MARAAVLEQRAAELTKAAAEADNLKDFLSSFEQNQNGRASCHAVTDYLPAESPPSSTSPIGR